MYLHEYQAKKLLQKWGIPVAPHRVVSSLQEVDDAIEEGIQEAVCKIQVHAGGRGKAGGIKVAKNPAEIKKHAQTLLGMRLVNNQTGPEGVVAEKVLLDSVVQFTKEYYLSIIIDRKNGCISVIASREGGMEIEEVAARSPEAIIVEKVPASGQLHQFQLNRLAKLLPGSIQIIENLIKGFSEIDATLIEINPLVETGEGLVALDAKISIDDNALFRQKELARLWDPSQMSKSERLAHEHELSWVALDGTIGCMVNGAGLAMATMDLIKFWGGAPANFLDVGGSASCEKITEGFKILFQENSVKAVLVNIFGGIMNCELIAKGLIEALKSVPFTGPIVLRMEGTNQESAKAMIKEAKIAVHLETSLNNAAKKVCELCRSS